MEEKNIACNAFVTAQILESTIQQAVEKALANLRLVENESSGSGFDQVEVVFNPSQ